MNPRTDSHPSATGVGHKGSFGVTSRCNNTCADDRPQVMERLLPPEPRVRHQDVCANRLDGVGEWLFHREEFVNWRDGGEEAILFCSGAPGVGKTYLSSLVIDSLSDRSVGQRVAVACFYCDFQHQRTQTPGNILGALVKQLIQGLGAIPTDINNAFRKAKGQVGGQGLRVAELLPLLQAAIAPLERAFICIDALDECLGKHLPELLRSLRTICQWSPKMRFFFTGRPHIGREVKKHFSGGVRLVHIKPPMEDTVNYAQMMLDNDPKAVAMDPDLRAEIVKRVSEAVPDVFILISLNIAAILAETTIHGRREQLNRMTNGLGLSNAYRVALDRMEAQDGARSKLGMAALMWVSRSERPMTADELCHALGVQIGSTDLNPESIPSIQTLLASCLGLIAVDKNGSTVRLVHFTLYEYLDSHPETFQSPYATMAEVCLTYLNYNCVTKISPTLDSAPPTTPFLQYASTYWGLYARKETTEGVKFLALPLLINFDSHISAKLLLLPHVYELRRKLGSRAEGFTGIHCAAFLGIDEITSALLPLECGDIDRADFLGRTPLIWAAKNGHEDTIKLFLKRKGIKFETKDTEMGRTALSWAARGGYEGIIKLLLDQEKVDPESRDNYGRTPLSYTAKRGNESTAKLFLDREDVDAAFRDNYGRTPLSHAAKRGDERTVKLFLEREEVNAESRHNDGRTPLSYAAEWGRVGAMNLLLEREEVNAESRDNGGRTPLSYAAGWGRVGAVKLLLERGEANADFQDNYGKTPLSYAAKGGHERIVRMLLDREEVNAESQDNGGRTPLSHAAGWGRVATVNLLTEREEVMAESRDNHGRTPLSHAAEGGDERTVKMLLDRIEVNAELRDNGGRTPLSYAANSGSVGVVKMFLDREEVSAESRDSCGRTLLSYAAESGIVEAVKLFLERAGADAESRDNDGRTPLSHAAQGWNVAMVNLFLEREEVNAESKDNHGRTPLSYAAESGIVEVVKLFLGREEIDAESRDNNGRTPLSYAAHGRNLAMVKLFLEWEEANAESEDNHGRTPLSYAAESGIVEVVKLFLEQQDVNAESQDDQGRTPLFYALKSGSEEIGKILLELAEINSRSRALPTDEQVAQVPKLDPLASPSANPVPPAVVAVHSLKPPLRKSRRRFFSHFGRRTLRYIMSKLKKPS